MLFSLEEGARMDGWMSGRGIEVIAEHWNRSYGRYSSLYLSRDVFSQPTH